MALALKTDSRRWVPLHLRDLLGLNAKDVFELNEASK
jgi:hypothetical protein